MVSCTVGDGVRVALGDGLGLEVGEELGVGLEAGEELGVTPGKVAAGRVAAGDVGELAGVSERLASAGRFAAVELGAGLRRAKTSQASTSTRNQPCRLSAAMI